MTEYLDVWVRLHQEGHGTTQSPNRAFPKLMWFVMSGCGGERKRKGKDGTADLHEVRLDMRIINTLEISEVPMAMAP